MHSARTHIVLARIALPIMVCVSTYAVQCTHTCTCMCEHICSAHACTCSCCSTQGWNKRCECGCWCVSAGLFLSVLRVLCYPLPCVYMDHNTVNGCTLACITYIHIPDILPLEFFLFLARESARGWVWVTVFAAMDINSTLSSIICVNISV